MRQGSRAALSLGLTAALLSTTWVVGCHTERGRAEVQSGPARAPAPLDRGELCLDVADARACWGTTATGDGCENGVCAAPRPLPSVPAPPSGFRCSGQGGARTCVSRARDGAPFHCDRARCTQTPLRFPDSAEWECVETAGAVTCRSMGEAAGIAAGPVDPAFTCGPRRTTGERICVDFAPDLPPLSDHPACHVSYLGGSAERECAASKEPRLGDVCASSNECPPGAACAGHRCLPPRPVPACWFDQDCGQSTRCLWGSCVASG